MEEKDFKIQKKEWFIIFIPFFGMFAIIYMFFSKAKPLIGEIWSALMFFPIILFGIFPPVYIGSKLVEILQISGKFFLLPTVLELYISGIIILLIEKWFLKIQKKKYYNENL